MATRWASSRAVGGDARWSTQRRRLRLALASVPVIAAAMLGALPGGTPAVEACSGWPTTIEGGLVAVGPSVLFTAWDRTHGMELWRTDASARGARLIKDIRRGSEASMSGADNGAVIDGVLYFFADDGRHGRELWRSDGTSDGTWLVVDLVPGRRGTWNASSPVVLGSEILFTAGGDGHGVRLWRSDGTAAGTSVVSEAPRRPGSLVVAGGVAHLAAGGTTDRPTELWRSDGTEVGTTLLTRSPDGLAIESAAAIGDRTFLTTTTRGAQDHRGQLWRTDGTPESTVLLTTFGPGKGTSFTGAMAVLDGAVYLLVEDSDRKASLWRSDGTDVGTTMIAEGLPGDGSVGPPGPTLAMGGSLFFVALVAANSTTPSELRTDQFALWRSDGTAIGTHPAVTLRDRQLAAFGVPGEVPTSLVLIANVDRFPVSSTQIWRTDGTVERTDLIRGIETATASGLTATPGGHHFVVHRLDTSSEVWRTDGTRKGTTRVIAVPGPRPDPVGVMGPLAMLC